MTMKERADKLHEEYDLIRTELAKIETVNHRSIILCSKIFEIIDELSLLTKKHD
jgi:hypothetical protein